MADRDTLSIICPFYNEQESLGELYARLRAMVQGLRTPCELIFADDGSTDGGRKLLERLISKDRTAHVVVQRGHRGKTTAIYSGICQSKGETLVTIDADLQGPPEEIPKFLSMLEGYDLVAGIRVSRKDGWFRRIVSKVAAGVRRAVLRDHIQDITCPILMFRRATLKSYYPFEGMHRFFPALAELEGFKILQVPVRHEARRYGRSKYGTWDRASQTFLDLIAVRWMISRRMEKRHGGI